MNGLAPTTTGYTYEDLDHSLIHKGHGATLQRRKIASNTWMVRQNDGAISVVLHQTTILWYYPDGRIVLSVGGWNTQLTRKRLNDFVDGRISASGGDLRIRLNFRIGAQYRWGDPKEPGSTWQQDNWRWYKDPTKFIEGTVPFENGMAINVQTWELSSHPMTTPVDLNIIRHPGVTASKALWVEERRLKELADEGKVTKADIQRGLMIKDEYMKQQTELITYLNQLNGGVNHSLESFEQELVRASGNQVKEDDEDDVVVST